MKNDELIKRNALIYERYKCQLDTIDQKELEYLRKEIKAERISYGEIIELQSLVKHIDPSDVELLEWAGIEETKI